MGMNTVTGDVFDLCPECMEKIENFMKIKIEERK